MLSTQACAYAFEDTQAVAQRLRKALGQQIDLLAALNVACAHGRELPISVSESIDIILDVIPRTEARIRELSAVANGRPFHGKSSSC